MPDEEIQVEVEVEVGVVVAGAARNEVRLKPGTGICERPAGPQRRDGGTRGDLSALVLVGISIAKTCVVLPRLTAKFSPEANLLAPLSPKLLI